MKTTNYRRHLRTMFLVLSCIVAASCATTDPTAPPDEVQQVAPPAIGGCVLRFANAAGVGCATAEHLTGGGCISGGTIKSSYPTPQTCNGCAPTSWQCDGVGPLTSYAICCS